MVIVTPTGASVPLVRRDIRTANSAEPFCNQRVKRVRHRFQSAFIPTMGLRNPTFVGDSSVNKTVGRSTALEQQQPRHQHAESKPNAHLDHCMSSKSDSGPADSDSEEHGQDRQARVE
jgi:hypothetical protein